jgi:dCTP deaminase
MSILSDGDLRSYLECGLLDIQPRHRDAIRPNSIDLRLAPELLVAKPDGFVPHHLIDDGPLRFEQHMFVLGATLEKITLPNTLTGVLAGKSSRAREGVQVESAGLVDSGWSGHLTLEIVMLSPIATYLMVGEMIGQLYLHSLLSPCDRPYGHKSLRSRYQGSVGPVESRGRIGAPS